MGGKSRPRLLALIVAYDAGKPLEPVLERIPASLVESCDLEVLAIQDESTKTPPQTPASERQASACRVSPTPDSGIQASPCSVGQTPDCKHRRLRTPDFLVTRLSNPIAQGYGGNQKIGFRYAIERGFDFVVLVHADGKYAPESLPELLAPLAADEADGVLGSRMLGAARLSRGGMPLYKFLGNRILTRFQNRLLRTHLSEFHCGYRAYSTSALRRIPFHLNSDGFQFDTEIIIQLVLAGLRIKEVPVPSYAAAELRHVSGIAYAASVVKACLLARAQEASLLFDRKFDCIPSTTSNVHYLPNLRFESEHTMALARIPDGSRVVDVGCAGGYLGQMLRERGCHVTGIDHLPLAEGCVLDEFHLYDLNRSPFPVDLTNVDYVLMIEVIEHLRSPEQFVDDFLVAAARNPNIKLVVSTGNVAFGIVRLMLLLGQFNYGKRGILDLTHLRLFTFGSFRRLFEQSGFRVLEMKGYAAPLPKALGYGWLGRSTHAVNRALMHVSRSFFAGGIFAVVQPKPALEYLLDRAQAADRQTARPGRG